MDWEVRAASLILCLGILLTTIQDGIAERRIVCYYTNWSVYRPGTAKFSPQNINPYLCTHLIYAFGGFTKENALKPFDKYQDIEKGGYAKFTGLKTYNKNLKTMLAIGGWNEGSSRFSPMVADPARRREFVKNAVKFLRQNHFDGLDLDWEYPAFRDGGKPRDKDNYANLVQELREEFERESSKTGRSRLLLSMAMPAGVEYIDKGYDVPRLNEYLDFINLLSYDYHSAYEPAVNHHSPLYPLEEDNEYNYDAELTIDYTITYLLEKGASADKVVLGIPTYGRSYTLFNQDATELGSPADGPGTEGEATREKGYLAYYEICEGIAESDEWEVVEPNPKAMGPYAFKGNQWVGYDDENVVKLKAHYVNEKKLGGIMFWSIDNDDFRGKCHGRPYPLIEAAKEALLTDNRNTIDKTKLVDSRKKTRTQSTQSNTRKSSTSNRRSSTTSAPITIKRISSSRPKYRTISQASKEEQEDREVSRRSYDPASNEDTEGAGNTVRITEKTERPKNRNRSKTRNAAADRNTRRKQSRRKGQNKTSETDESLSNKLTTPEPPTTPDPGTDFKCEDEGFFPHPRDCKKYFWCLDSGPSGLGVVAHQFTCPSGLVFNKAADSCDYPRNVICPKALKTIVSTTKSPITAATSRTTYLHSTTTVKTESEEYDSEEDYDEIEESEEEEEEEEKEEPKITTTAKPLVYKTLTRNRPSTTTTTTTTSKPSEPERIINSEDEEDPKVIKELIDLIKKAGGIEELEKQLLLQEKNSDNKSGSESVTPATISRSLYERVLSRQANRIGNQRPVLSSSETSYVNGPGRAQFEGLDDIPEVKSLRRSQKPQYITIERSKSVTKGSSSENEDIDENIEDDNTDVASSEEKSISNPLEDSTSTQRVTPSYVNIRRTRLSTTTSRIENDVEEKKVEIEEEKPTRRRRPFISLKQQDNEASSETSKPFRHRGSGFRKSEKRNDSGTNRSTEKDDDSSTTKTRYANVQRFRSTTLKTLEDLSSVIPSSASISETTSPTRSEVSRTTASTTASLSTTPAATTSTSTEVITVISVEPPENSSSVSSKTDISSTTDSMKLVEDSATEILFTTLPASSLSQSTTTTSTTAATLTSRSTIAAVSQPRPFGFPRRRSGSSEATTTATTPLSRSKVADSETIRLPTLKELIGYPTTYYDDHTATTLSSVFLYLLRNDVDNDISRQNVEESLTGTDELRDGEKEIVQSSRGIIEETGDLLLQQASENKARSHAPRKEDVFDERISVTNTIRGDKNKQKMSTTSLYLKPTTMRGIPLASLISSPVIRGFYVTRSENDDVPSPILADSSTPFYTTDTSVEQQTETTLIPDISTIDKAITIAYNDQIESRPNIPDDKMNDIINDKGIVNREERYSTPSSSVIFSNAENLSNHKKPNLITVPVDSIFESAFKRRKSLHNFDHTTPLSNLYVASPTTPTRRKIALTVSKYNEATTPLWTGRRIVVKKRNRTTVSPIKDAIRQIESDSIHAATSTLRSTFLTSKAASNVISRRRKLSATSTMPTVPLMVSNSSASSEILNIYNNFTNSNDSKIEDSENHASEAAISINSITTTPSILKIISTTNDLTTTDISTSSDDSTTTAVHAVVNASILTPSVAVAKAPAVATDATITTSATTSVGETALNYSVTDNPMIENTNAFLTDPPTTIAFAASTETEITSTNVNIVPQITPTIATDPVIKSTVANTEVEITSTINSIITVPITANAQEIATDSANMTTIEITNANIGATSTIANYSTIPIPTTISTYDIVTNSTILNTAANAEIETSSMNRNYSTFTTTVIKNTTTIPVTTTGATTIISSTVNTQHIRATEPMSMRNLADANTVTADITTTTPLSVITPTIIDLNVTTSANTNIPSISATSEIPPTTIQSPVTNIVVPLMNSAGSTTLTTDSSTIFLANSSNLDIGSNSEILVDTATVESTKIPMTFENPPTFTSAATAFPLFNTNFEASFVTAALSTQEVNENSIPIITQTPSTPFYSIATSITKATVALEKSTTSMMPFATSGESIATNSTNQTITNTYKPDSIQTINEKSLIPEQKTDFKETTSTKIQNQIKYQTATTINKPIFTETMIDEFTTPKIKVISEKVISKAAESQKSQNQTISKLNTTNYQSSQKTARRRVLNRTKNWHGSLATLQKTDQNPRHQVTSYRGQSRRPPAYISSSKMIEKNHRRRIMQKRIRVNSKAFNSTIRADQETIDVQNTTKDHVYDPVENIIRRKAVNSTEKVEEKTTMLLQSSTATQNETFQAHHENENIGEQQKAELKQIKHPQESFTTKETSINSSSTNESLPGNTQSNLHVAVNFSELENPRKIMKVVLNNARPKSEEKHPIEEMSVESDSINTNQQDNFPKSSYASKNSSDKRIARRRMRIILKNIRPKSEEKNSTIEETYMNPDPIYKNLQNNLLNNFNISQNFSNEEKTRRKTRVVLKRINSKSEKEESKTEEASTEYDSINESLQGTFSNNFYSAKNFPDEYRTRRRMRVVLKSVKPKSEKRNSTVKETSVDSDSINKNFQSTFSNNFHRDKNLPIEHGTRRRMRVVLKSVKPEKRNSTVEETSIDTDSINKNFQREHGTRRRMRVVLKSIKPKSEKKNSTVEKTNVDSDFINKDFQDNFSNNFHMNESLSNEEEVRKGMEVKLKSVKPESKETDSVAEETNLDSDFIRNDSQQVLYKFHFSSNLRVGDNLSGKEKTMKHSKSEEEKAMTEQPEVTEPQMGTSVPVEDTDRPSLEVTNSGSVNRNPGSGYSNRHRKPTPFTTIAPLTNTLSNTVHRRGRPVQTTLSSRVDFVDTFESTESYVKPAAVLHDQNADVSDQSIRAQEFAVTLSDPPSSSSADIGQTPLRDADWRKISTTISPRTDYLTTSRTVSRYDANFRSRQKFRTKDRPTVNATTRPRRPPVIDYDYYEDEVPIVIGKSVLNSKLFLTSKGTIRCLDQGNFPHPYSCKKFITCARMVNGQAIGTEYTCPDKLSFDPVGGICNWSAGLGCKD
ncbi:PREDICTED: uncharacterized protein LOC105459591 isoform X2 [Wasmannia auropunctata]|uniref:uncharacterized protein LOC105459591 isoform X2 n=1 Tax=Wasmannia auropunctata TaxID=64793 RepID=UPI0005ED932A|nr:PREDICTED: uncharacterized protein LOC105459591 isoform X2 [Wasmannia auropunctata]